MVAIVETEKLTFDLKEIPEGKSSRRVKLLNEDLVLERELRFLEADVEISFYKTNHFVDVNFELIAKAELTCDRSLKTFEKELKGSYHIHYDPNPVEETESDKGALRQIPTLDLVIDITKEVKDTIMLEVPIQKIHPDYLDESGKPIEFETKKFGDVDNNGDEIDPRWSALKKLK